MRNKVDSRLQRLETLAGVKKKSFKVYIWEYGEDKPVIEDDGGLKVIIRMFGDPDRVSEPAPVFQEKPPRAEKSLDEEIALVVNELKLSGYNNQEIEAMVEDIKQTELPQKTSGIDQGRYRSRDRSWSWM